MEAFDPFADDDDIQEEGSKQRTPPRSSSSPIIIPSPRDNKARNSPKQGRRNSSKTKTNINTQADIDIMKEFSSFSSMNLNETSTNTGTFDEFGFPKNSFPATFEDGVSVLTSDNNNIDNDANDANQILNVQNDKPNSLEGVSVIISEEMSVIHKSQTNQCSVNVRGSLSLETTTASTNKNISCNLSFLDDKAYLDTITSKNSLCTVVRATNPSHDISISDSTIIKIDGEVNSNTGSSSLIEYTCKDNLRPVPMLITTTVEELDDKCRIQLQLRVNPRNANSLLNTVVLICVPSEYDGETAKVSSVGRSIGKGDIDTTNWSGEITRIFSWRLGELYSGAVCEFEAFFPLNDIVAEQQSEEEKNENEPKFPILLRYDCEGSLLSDVDLHFGGARASSVSRKFRVFARCEWFIDGSLATHAKEKRH